MSRLFNFGAHVSGTWETQPGVPEIVGYWFNVSDASGQIMSDYVGGGG
ncbi:MAG: hypothetical protein L3J97_00100 [Thermoplasmata archaeon]|nr:hypothetical protein [Thermoplasmata archaeon]